MTFILSVTFLIIYFFSEKHELELVHVVALQIVNTQKAIC